MRVDGTLWYHSFSRPGESYYSHSPYPIIHNFGITLALAGYDVDPNMGYASIFGKKSYRNPLKVFNEYGIYSYPAIATKVFLKEMVMSASGEPIVEIKSKGRLSYPDMTSNIILAPGSELETTIVSTSEMPKRMVIRIGAKRSGTITVELSNVKPEEKENEMVNMPFNLSDVDKVHEPVIVYNHEAGDIAMFGYATRAWAYTLNYGRKKNVIVPSLRGKNIW